MTQPCCLRCRLRYSPVASSYITTCPWCDGPLHPIRLESSLGFRLVAPEDLPFEMPEAIAVALPPPETDGRL